MELAVDNENQIYDLSDRSKRKKFVKPVVNEAFSEDVYKKIMYDYNNGTPEEREQAQCDMLKFLNNFMYATLAPLSLSLRETFTFKDPFE